MTGAALGKVITVLQIKAGDPAEAFIQLQAGLALLFAACIYHRNGGRRISEGPFHTGTGNGHRLQGCRFGKQ